MWDCRITESLPIEEPYLGGLLMTFNIQSRQSRNGQLPIEIIHVAYSMP